MKEAKIESKPQVQIVEPDKIRTLLEPGELGAMLDWKVTDSKTGLVMPDPKTGKLNQGSKKSESFVQQFMQLLTCWFANNQINTPITNVRDTGNTLRSVRNSGYNFDLVGPISNTSYGIVVGIDTGGPHAPAVTDYALVTLIATGGGGGQLNYSITSFGAPASDASISQFTVTRNFANASGGDITVMEVGLYCRAADSGGTVRYFMIIRDVTGTGILIPNGQTLTMNYRLQATV